MEIIACYFPGPI